MVVSSRWNRPPCLDARGTFGWRSSYTLHYTTQAETHNQGWKRLPGMWGRGVARDRPCLNCDGRPQQIIYVPTRTLDLTITVSHL